MRGKGAASGAFGFTFRITPAYAGKRPAGRSTASTPKDHPRLCGEKVRMYAAVSANLGSPPPMRGKASWDQTAVAFQWDHPRLCGEKHQAR